MTSTRRNFDPSLIRTTLFDMDGTLVDTEPAAAKAVEKCFFSWGVSVSKEDSHYVTGRKWSLALDYLLQKYPLHLDRSHIEGVVLQTYREEIKNTLPIIPGAVEAVHAFSKKFPIALVSGSHRAEIDFILDQLKIKSCFQFYLGAEDYADSKPHPSGFLLAFQKLGIPPDEGIVFEDSWAGIESGRKAGAWVVAIEAANHFDQDQSHADFKIPDFRGLHPDSLGRLLT